MRYVVKQRILSFADSFVIYDEAKRPAFEVQGKLFAFGDKLTIYDMRNKEEIYIEQKLFKFLPEYHFFKQGRRTAVVKKQFTFVRPKFNIESDCGVYAVEGNIWGYNFRIIKDGIVVARVDKAFLSFRDTYTVDISSGQDEGFLLAVCIVIDQTLHDNNHNNN